MDEFLQKQLREGEKILWQGRPADVQVFESTCKPHLIAKWITSAVLLALAAAYAAYSLSMGWETKGLVLVCSIIVICAVGMAVGPFLIKGGLEKSYRYFITNQRFIAYKSGVNPRIDWRESDDVKEATIQMIDADHGNIYVGPKDKKATKALRMDIRASYSPEYKDSTLPFCSVKGAMEAAEYFPDKIKVQKIKA